MLDGGKRLLVGPKRPKSLLLLFICPRNVFQACQRQKKRRGERNDFSPLLLLPSCRRRQRKMAISLLHLDGQLFPLFLPHFLDFGNWSVCLCVCLSFWSLFQLRSSSQIQSLSYTPAKPVFSKRTSSFASSSSSSCSAYDRGSLAEDLKPPS